MLIVLLFVYYRFAYSLLLFRVLDFVWCGMVCAYCGVCVVVSYRFVVWTSIWGGAYCLLDGRFDCACSFAFVLLLVCCAIGTRFCGWGVIWLLFGVVLLGCRGFVVLVGLQLLVMVFVGFVYCGHFLVAVVCECLWLVCWFAS